MQEDNHPTIKQHMTFVPWGSVAAIFIAIGGYFVSNILGVLIFRVINGETDLVSLASSNSSQFVLIALISIIEFVIVYAYVLHRGGNGKDLGLQKTNIKQLAMVFPAYAVYFSVLIAATFIAPLFFSEEILNQEQEIGFDASTEFGVAEQLLVFTALVVVAPVLEEIVFRGFMFKGLIKKGLRTLVIVVATSLVIFNYLYFIGFDAFEAAAQLTEDDMAEVYIIEFFKILGLGSLVVWALNGLLPAMKSVSKHTNIVAAAISSSGLFALAHMQINVGIDTFILGMVSCALLIKTKSIWPSVGLHAIKNAIAFVALFVLELNM